MKNGRQHISDRENYIDFRMRLLGEPGTYTQYLNTHTFTFISNSMILECVSTLYETLFIVYKKFTNNMSVIFRDKSNSRPVEITYKR